MTESEAVARQHDPSNAIAQSRALLRKGASSSAACLLLLLANACVLTGCLTDKSEADMDGVSDGFIWEAMHPGNAVTNAAPEIKAEPVAIVTPPMRLGASGTITNSLGMRFVSIPKAKTKLHVSIWETRVADYRAFVEASGRDWPAAPFVQGDDHPAVMVSWEDAVAFCRWLTAAETASGVLPTGARYRLPDDAEWSVAVGTSASVKNTDEATGAFPWGREWPPPAGAGNYHRALEVDPFAYTAPVGSFSPGPHGLYDMGGNVWEWCRDLYNRSPDFRILRGASWRMRAPSDLLADTRVGNTTSVRLNAYGFRIVIEPPR